MEKISLTDRVRNEEVFQTVEQEKNILQKKIKRMKANCIDHILRRNCLLQYVIEGNIEEGIQVKGRRRRRRNQVLDVINKTTGYWKLRT